MTTASIESVLVWLAAVNAGDSGRVLSCTAVDVRIIGPRGTAHGHEVLRSWLGHAGATFTTHAVYGCSDTVVVAQRGVWSDPATGAVLGTAEVATRFLVAGRQVIEIQRYDDLAIALKEAGLTLKDRVPQPPDPDAA